MNLVQDLRFAMRQLRRSPGFTAMAVMTLALGIGAATAVFSLVDTVLLHPLPFRAPDRLVALDTLSEPRGCTGAPTLPQDTSYPNFFDWREQAKSFESMASWGGNSFTLGSTQGAARRIDGTTVSADFFHVLGVQPELGRAFTRAEEQPGNRSVMISHGLWQTEFGSSAAVIGRALHLNDEIYTVVGVLPASFQFPNAPDVQVWVTPASAREGKNSSGVQRGWNQLQVLARLRDGVSVNEARAEMGTIQRALAKQYPDEDGRETAVSVKPELEDLVGDVGRPLRILFGAVTFLLLIACANVAGLLLTRTAARRSELALRSALGASRMQIVRQLLIEFLTLSILGGVGGFALAAAALRVAPQVLPSDLPRLHELALNPRVLAFSLVASVLTGLIFGVLPAWRSSKLDPALALRDSTRSSTASKSQSALHSGLVIGETALGLMLLVGAGLLIRSFDRLLSVDPGFNYHNVVTFRVGMPQKRFQDEKLLQATQQMQARFASLPGVKVSTYAFPMPLSAGDMNVTFSIDGQPNAVGDDPTARASIVPTGFFEAMQIPLIKGRFFGAAEDRSGTPPVVIVNEALARRFFAGDALGKRITSGISSGDKPESREIVGVSGNVVRGRLSENPEPEYYIPFAQVSISPPVFALRVAGDPAAYVEPIRAAVAQMDASLPVYGVRTNLLAKSTAQQRFQTILISTFALLALLLSAVGLYAVLSYMVTQRTMELGLRMALGAKRSDVLQMVLSRGLMLCGAGIVLGLGAAAGLSRLLTTLLFHTNGLDAVTFAATTGLLVVISMASCLVPAWRASRLDPNETLRQQ